MEIVHVTEADELTPEDQRFCEATKAWFNGRCGERTIGGTGTHEHRPAFRRRTRPAQRNYEGDPHVFGQRQVPFAARLTGSNADLPLTPVDVFPLERRDLRGA